MEAEKYTNTQKRIPINGILAFSMISFIFKNKIGKFLSIALLLYLAWFLVYELWLHPQQTLDLYVIGISITLSKKILLFLGYQVFTGAERLIGIDGTGGLWIGDNCNAIVLFAIFSGFIMAYPGKILRKLIYIPIGIMLIEVVNIIRIVLLALMQYHSPDIMEFNHTYTFTIVIYGFIFLLWMIWVNRFSNTSLETAGEK